MRAETGVLLWRRNPGKKKSTGKRGGEKYRKCGRQQGQKRESSREMVGLMSGHGPEGWRSEHRGDGEIKKKKER